MCANCVNSLCRSVRLVVVSCQAISGANVFAIAGMVSDVHSAVLLAVLCSVSVFGQTQESPDPPNCGPASSGNLTCSGQEDPCCSKWGHCGRTSLHCAAATCLPGYGSCNLATGPATIVTTQNEHRLCGYSPSSGNITDMRCPDSACCSIYGWCGYGDQYCKGCQANYGYCPKVCDANSAFCGPGSIATCVLAVLSLVAAIVAAVKAFMAKGTP